MRILSTKDVDILSIRLATIEEAKKIPVNLMETTEGWWWLADKGYLDKYAAFVSGNNHVHDGGFPVTADGNLRPIAHIKVHRGIKFELYDAVKIGGEIWVIFMTEKDGSVKALCNSFIGKEQFNPDVRMANSNVYLGSTVESTVNKWIKKNGIQLKG